MTAADQPAPPIITLTTDFGLSDPYVAAMKGAILRISPHARIVDVTHDVAPQRILQALFVTQCAWPFFPREAVHVAVIDPGVGSERCALAIETPHGRFVGPDNGVLSSALADDARPAAGEEPALVALPLGYRAVSITERRYMLEPVSATFHARDIFAPAAAHLSRGLPLEALGEPVERILAFPPLRAQRRADGSLLGQVLHVDRFGNVITDVHSADVPKGDVVIEIGGRAVNGLVRTYIDATGLAAIVGSSGYIEIALAGASAAAELAVALGDQVVLRPGG
jgi:S-adenosylmethionine hydrolase